MPWIKNGVEYSEYQIREAHPNTSFPRPMESHHVADFGYTRQEPAEPEPQAPIVPSQVTMRQARLALLASGLLTTVNDTIAAMPGSQGDAAKIEWEYALSVDLNSPLVAGLTGVLGLTSEQLDNLFTLAASL